VVRVFKPELVVGEAPDSLRERPVQHQEPPVHTKSVDFVWPAHGLHGAVFILHHLTQESLLPICSAERHLVMQGRSKSLEKIEI